MDQFQRTGGNDRTFLRLAKRRGCRHAKRRPDALATAQNTVSHGLLQAFRAVAGCTKLALKFVVNLIAALLQESCQAGVRS